MKKYLQITARNLSPKCQKITKNFRTKLTINGERERGGCWCTCAERFGQLTCTLRLTPRRMESNCARIKLNIYRGLNTNSRLNAAESVRHNDSSQQLVSFAIPYLTCVPSPKPVQADRKHHKMIAISV